MWLRFFDVCCKTPTLYEFDAHILAYAGIRYYLNEFVSFQNVRMRYTNYLWVEAVAVVPITEYYRTKYTID